MVVADVDLVLAVGRLALGELDRDVRLGHEVAQEPMQGFRLGRLEEVVVLVVMAEGLRDGMAALGQLLPRVLEHVELELRARLQHETGVGGQRDLALEDGPRRDRDLLAGLLVDGVGEDQGGARQPGEVAELIPDRLGDPVAVPGLPVHELEALGRVHLHVRAEQVRTEVRPVADDAVEERLALDALAHEPTLHVGDRDHDRVDPTVADHRLQLQETGVTGRVVLVAHPILRGSDRLAVSRASWSRWGRRSRTRPAATAHPDAGRSPPRGASSRHRWSRPGAGSIRSRGR